jgi:hypothetical protein
MTTNKPNTGFWIIAVIALIWNIMGVFAFLGQTFLMNDDARALMTAEQLELIDSTPTWVTVIFAIAVISGLLGCILLLLRKKMAVSLFGLSLITVLIQMGYSWFATTAAEVYGPVQGYVMPLIVIVIAIFLYYYSKGAAQKGWLH